MNVSPAGSGNITSPSFSTPTSYPATFSCSTNYSLTAVPNDAAGYKFDHWGGSYSGTSMTLSVSVSDGAKSVTAYFALKSEGVSLSEAKNMINTNMDLIVIDVSSAADFNNGHILCAKNYPWNGSTLGSIAALTPYKNYDILLYDRTGASSDNAGDYMSTQGFTSVYYMTDGLDDWIAAGYATFMTAEDGGICTSIPPLAFAGPDKTVNENVSVTLNGQGPAGSTFLWTQTEGTNVTLSSQTVAQPTFTAPDLTSGDDELIFLLTVTNGGLKDSDTVTVNVTWNNQAPTANAGPDQTVKAGATVILDGSKSTDQESQASLTYNWSVSAASGVSVPTLSNASSKKPTFVAPNKDGWVEFRLIVTDNGDQTDDDKVKITVKYAPSGLTATANSSSSVVLSWNDNSGNETGFKIEKREGNCSSSNTWTPLVTTAVNATSYTAAGLAAAKTYSFRMKASGSGGESGYSNCAAATTSAAGTPRSPSNLTATSASASQINLAWKDNSTNETGFEIWRKAGGSSWVKLFTPAANAVAYSDVAASGNQSTVIYQYYVKAINASGSSPGSTTAIVPYGPTNLSAAALATPGKIKLTWTDKSSNENGFQIYRKSGACSGSGTWALVATVGPNIATWTNSGLTPGSVYSYEVRAYCRSAAPFSYGYSQWTSCDDATSP